MSEVWFQRSRRENREPPNLHLTTLKPTSLIINTPREYQVSGHNFNLSFEIASNARDPISSVSVDFFSHKGDLITSFTTTSPIPPQITSELLRILNTAYERMPNTTFKETINLLVERSPVKWIRTDHVKTCIEEDAHPRASHDYFSPIVGKLIDLSKRPSLIDEQLELTLDNNGLRERMSIRIHPQYGYMICKLYPDSYQLECQEFKITADISELRTELDVSRFLRTQADQLLDQIRDLGCEKVLTEIKNKPFETFAIPFYESQQITGLPVTASLIIDKQHANINVSHIQHDYSTTFIFYCSKDYPELTSSQLDYILSAYQLLISPLAADRQNGAKMCHPGGLKKFISCLRQSVESSQDQNKKVPKLHLKPLEALKIQRVSSKTFLKNLFSQDEASYLTDKLSIKISDSGITNTISGNLELSVTRRNSAKGFNDSPHIFNSLTCLLRPDSTIKVEITNQIGGNYHALIETDGVQSQRNIIKSILQNFADSSGSNWIQVIQHIDDLISHQKRAEKQTSTESSVKTDSTPASSNSTQEIDPHYDLEPGLPPYKDPIALNMLLEGVKCYNFVRAGFTLDNQLAIGNIKIQYANPGAVSIRFCDGSSTGAIEFILKDSALREVTILRRAETSNPNAVQLIPYYRFISESLNIGSTAYDQILREVSVVYQTFYGDQWRTDYEKLFDSEFRKLTELLLSNMTCVKQPSPPQHFI